MKSETRELVKFATATNFNDLSVEAVHEAKRVFLDSAGCALGGIAVDKGKFAIQFARSIGGGDESTILGTGDKVSSPAAAFANGELINALDWDSVLAPAHVTPFVISPPLALGESRGASGKDLITAIALGHEISTRIGRALQDAIFDEDGKLKPYEVMGFGSAIFGGAIGAGKILKLGEEKMLYAFGLAGHMAPVPAHIKWKMSTPSGTDKFLSAGWTSLGGVSAALLAETGYTGDTTVLDGNYGFWKYFGAGTWHPDTLLQKLGDEWKFLEINYKPYPCCGHINVALDCFIDIIEESSLKPEDIDSVTALVSPSLDFPVWTDNKCVDHVDAQFSLPYIFAVVAHGIPMFDWQGPDVLRNPGILGFMKRVSFKTHPDFGKAWVQNHKNHLASVEVLARGQRFKKEKMWAKGDYHLEEARMKDEELEKKFRANASRVLSRENTEKAVKAIFELEKAGNIMELTAILSR